MDLEKPEFPTRSDLLLDPKRPFIHRDLSWIQFNERVLAEAKTNKNPFLKRAKFLSISASNLDEFFMIRYASLLRSISSTKIPENIQNLTRIHNTLLENVQDFLEKQHASFDSLRIGGIKNGVFLHTKPAQDLLAKAFEEKLFSHEIFPKLKIRSGSLMTALAEGKNLQKFVFFNRTLFFEIPSEIPEVFSLISPDTKKIHYFFLDILILNNLAKMFSTPGSPGIFRITRDSDYSVNFSETDTESIPDLVKKTLRKKDQGRLVRLEGKGEIPAELMHEALVKLRIDPKQYYFCKNTLCLSGLIRSVSELPNSILRRPELDNPPLKAMVPKRFRDPVSPEIFQALKNRDVLFHHPYDSFSCFLSWLKMAADDPSVTMIEQTIYRTGSVSEIVDILKKAAPKKKVKVVLELRARFDETNNLRVAEELTKAGAEVRFGFGALKLHAKITLITRNESGKNVLYTHLSTGNYNAKTARLYTDISIITASAEMGEDARLFFDSIYKNEVTTNYKHLVIAPTKLHPKIRALIKSETEAAKSGKPARIIAKVNALVDEKIIEDLYNASQAGVKIDLIVRGACSLIPGVPGLSENIRVISIVDRFLEHSRIYYFRNSQVIYLSSADWMPRNFFSRLEIAFPVLDAKLYQFITDIVLPGYLKDNTKSWNLTPLGIWKRVKDNKQPHRAQFYFTELAAKSYKDTPLINH